MGGFMAAASLGWRTVNKISAATMIEPGSERNDSLSTKPRRQESKDTMLVSPNCTTVGLKDGVIRDMIGK
jgi:hypothetical protein